jgi:hypothetical protein
MRAQVTRRSRKMVTSCCRLTSACSPTAAMRGSRCEPAPRGAPAADASALSEPADPAARVAAPAPAGPGGSSAGFRYLAAEPVLRAITITLALVLLTLGFTESAGFSVVTAGLHRSASFVGVLGVFQGAGAIAGGVLAAPLLKRTSESLLVMAGLGLLAAIAVVALMAAGVPAQRP